MPRFEFTRLTDEWLGYLLAHPLAFVLLAATLIGLGLWLFVRGSHEDRDAIDDTIADALHAYAPRSFSVPAKKGIERTPNVIPIQAYRRRA